MSFVAIFRVSASFRFALFTRQCAAPVDPSIVATIGSDGFTQYGERFDVINAGVCEAIAPYFFASLNPYPAVCTDFNTLFSNRSNRIKRLGPKL